MKRLISISLVFLLMLQFFAQLGTMAWFGLNRAEIAAEFCVNKDVPDSCCKGKCYLGKQLGDLEHESESRTLMEEKEIPYFVLPSNPLCFHFFGDLNAFSPARAFSLASGYVRSGLKPPIDFSLPFQA